MADEFLQEVKNLLADLPDYYQKLIDENYKKYIDYRYNQGYSMTRIKNSFGDERDVADRYLFYYKLHQVCGRRRLKGAGSLIKQALKNKSLPRQYYSAKKSGYIFKSILMFLLGVALLIASVLFFAGNLDNPWGMNASVIALSLFLFGTGIGSLYYIFVMRHKFQNDMLSKAMDGCNLDYFGK